MTLSFIEAVFNISNTVSSFVEYQNKSKIALKIKIHPTKVLPKLYKFIMRIGLNTYK